MFMGLTTTFDWTELNLSSEVNSTQYIKDEEQHMDLEPQVLTPLSGDDL